MTDIPPHSGSRWEPTTPVSAEDIRNGPLPDAPAAPVPDREPRGDADRRLRGALAGAALGLVAAGGLGGFAVAHAITDDRPAHVGTVGDPDSDPAGRDDGTVLPPRSDDGFEGDSDGDSDGEPT